MSYWVFLKDENGNTLEVDRHQEGGTQPIGGTTDAELNITYNYSEAYGLLGFNIRHLHGKKARDTEHVLARVTVFLGTQQYKRDYWAPTPGNAGFATGILLKWAQQHPDGIWEVS